MLSPSQHWCFGLFFGSSWIFGGTLAGNVGARPRSVISLHRSLDIHASVPTKKRSFA
ncbi:hypothetical protein BDI4_190005 [Burkholderia diffusa]|nr:hypothetical protein BDI4_190005 [Burkholderia diffusa]